MPDMLSVLPLAHIVFLGLAVMFAAVMRAFSGFGFALLAVPVFSLFLTPSQSVVVAAGLTLIVSGAKPKAWWGQFPTQFLPPMAAGAGLGSVVGVWFLSGLTARDFQLWIGLLVIAACLALIRFKPKADRGSVPTAALTGVASGLMNGAFAIPGPPVILFVMATLQEARESRAFLMVFFLISNGIAMVLFALAGMVTTTTLALIALALPVMLLGDYLGAWLFKQIGGGAYRPVALAITILVGVSITAKALWAAG